MGNKIAAWIAIIGMFFVFATIIIPGLKEITSAVNLVGTVVFLVMLSIAVAMLKR